MNRTRAPARESAHRRMGREVESRRKIYDHGSETVAEERVYTRFDVTMPDVHLYGLHYNLHCAPRPCACTRARKRTRYRVTRAFTRRYIARVYTCLCIEFGTCATRRGKHVRGVVVPRVQ